MTRKRDPLGSDQPANEDRPVPEVVETAHDARDATDGANPPDVTDAAESAVEGGAVASADEASVILPTEDDLHAQGFSPDEVRQLVLVSAREERSQESRDAEAQLRRLRFMRWLVERGVLDEWSA